MAVVAEEARKLEVGFKENSENQFKQVHMIQYVTLLLFVHVKLKVVHQGN